MKNNYLLPKKIFYSALNKSTLVDMPSNLPSKQLILNFCNNLWVWKQKKMNTRQELPIYYEGGGMTVSSAALSSLSIKRVPLDR